MSDIATRLAGVQERIASACERAGRKADEVRLVAVSKRHSAEAIAEAASAGLTIMGENYVQEMMDKVEEVPGVDWHFIGRLQRNKVKFVVGRAALLHCVDSERLLVEVGKRASQQGVVQDLLIAVNLAGEAQKSGVLPEACAGLVRRANELGGVRCLGLMAMPPLPRVAEDSRPYFAQLRALRDQLATDDVPLRELSMGTTGDFEVAVEEGATLVRVGTAIFGPRPA